MSNTKDADPRRPLDLRTKAGRRAEILSQVREHGGFSIFWITEHRLRAVVGTEMVNRKEIHVRNKRFPWSDVTILANDLDDRIYTPR